MAKSKQTTQKKENIIRKEENNMKETARGYMNYLTDPETGMLILTKEGKPRPVNIVFMYSGKKFTVDLIAQPGDRYIDYKTGEVKSAHEYHKVKIEPETKEKTTANDSAL